MQSACITLVSFRVQDSRNRLYRCGNQGHGGPSPTRTQTPPSEHPPATSRICWHQGRSVHNFGRGGCFGLKVNDFLVLKCDFSCLLFPKERVGGDNSSSMFLLFENGIGFFVDLDQ